MSDDWLYPLYSRVAFIELGAREPKAGVIRGRQATTGLHTGSEVTEYRIEVESDRALRTRPKFVTIPESYIICDLPDSQQVADVQAWLERPARIPPMQAASAYLFHPGRIQKVSSSSHAITFNGYATNYVTYDEFRAYKADQA